MEELSLLNSMVIDENLRFLLSKIVNINQSLKTEVKTLKEEIIKLKEKYSELEKNVKNNKKI